MKLQNTPLPGIPTPSPARPEDVSAERGQRYRASTGPATGHDQVDLSGLASRLSQAVEAASARHVQRVAQLAKAYEQGRYAPDPALVSCALVDAWIKQPGTPGGRGA